MLLRSQTLIFTKKTNFLPQIIKFKAERFSCLLPRECLNSALVQLELEAFQLGLARLGQILGQLVSNRLKEMSYSYTLEF